MVESLEVEGVGAAVSEHKAACLVVGCHNDKCLLGVFLVKLYRLGYGCVEVEHFVEHGGCVVAVRCIVYLSALYHQEETFLAFVGKEVYRSVGHLCKSEVVGCAVYCIRYIFAYILLVEHHLFRVVGLCEVVIVSAGDGVTLFFGFCIEGLALLGGALGVAAAIKVVVCGEHLLCYLVVVVTALVVGVESAGCGVVYAHGGGNTHGIACLFGCVSNAIHGLCCCVYAYISVHGLVTCGKCCARRCRVGYSVTCRKSCYKSSVGKLCETQGGGAAYSALLLAQEELGAENV